MKVSEVCCHTSVFCIIFQILHCRRRLNTPRRLLASVFLGLPASNSRQNNWLTRLFWKFEVMYFSVSTGFIHILLMCHQKWKMHKHDCCCKDFKFRLLQVFLMFTLTSVFMDISSLYFLMDKCLLQQLKNLGPQTQTDKILTVPACFCY